MRDFRFALRDLIKNPGFALLAIATLAVAIGTTTAMFSVIRGVLMEPLPYPEADRLYRIFYTNAHYPKFPVNPSDFLDLRDRNRVFEAMAVFTENDLELSDRDRPERLTALQISRDYFRVLGGRMELGRDLERSDEIRGNQNVVILSHELWARRFASDRGILGRSVHMNGQPFTVIGVAAAGF